jgi:hypothetical protein
MRIAFGAGSKQWSNHAPSALTARLQPDIARFGALLKWVARLEIIFVFVPIHRLLSLWGFSRDFCEQMVYPLVRGVLLVPLGYPLCSGEGLLCGQRGVPAFRLHVELRGSERWAIES